MQTKSHSLLGKIKVFFVRLKQGVRRFWTWYKHLYLGQPWWKKTLVGILSFFSLLLIYIIAVMTNFLWLFGKSPSLSEIMHPKNPSASEIYSADGQMIGRYYNENRSPVPYDSINKVFFEALVATEDERFYEHHGIDYQGLAAAAKDALLGHPRGASTITQQLVKNMFRVRTQYGTGLLGKIPGVRILIMKSKEMIIATEIELTNSKQDILRMYANTVDFGSNSYGIKTAAKTYFNTTPSKLKTEEAAVLVGMLKATNAFNPRINPKRSLARRNTVLEKMCARKFLTRQECDSLKQLPIELKFTIEDPTDGLAPYFRQAVADYLKKQLPDLDLYTDGVKVYTTLDAKMQQYAEEAVREQMKVVQRNFDVHWRGLGEPWRDEEGKIIPRFIEDIAARSDAYKQLAARYPNNPDSVNYYLNKPHKVKLFGYDGAKEEEMSTMDSIRFMVKFMHAGFISMEPNTGYVRAWVGDIDFDAWKYDKVRSMRQPGSTFKLFVYSAAMESGLTPSDSRKDEYIQMEVYDKIKKKDVIWRPHNANGRFSNANIPLRAAFARSINTIAVKVGQEVGIPRVVQTAKAMGIKSPLDDTPSLALGSSDVNLIEMVNAYGTIANEGVHVEPVLVTKVVDSDGKVLYENKTESSQAISWRSAFFMQKMLEAGMTDAGGTSQSMRHYMSAPYWNKQIEVGGKTGTSNNHSDAWFICVTPALVSGAWVGGEYRSIHFRTGALGQGSKTALPIVGLFMQKVLADPQLSPRYIKKFPLPKEAINPNDYGGDYIGSPNTDADSRQGGSDSLSNASEDLFGNEEAESKPSESTAPRAEPAQENVPAEDKKGKAGRHKDKKQPVKDSEDLFN